jgi:hypothetical protein
MRYGVRFAETAVRRSLSRQGACPSPEPLSKILVAKFEAMGRVRANQSLTPRVGKKRLLSRRRAILGGANFRAARRGILLRFASAIVVH